MFILVWICVTFHPWSDLISHRENSKWSPSKRITRQNIQSAYWSNRNKYRRKVSVLWTIGEHWEFTFISQLAACPYRPLHMYCPLLHPRMQSLHGYRKFLSSHSHHKRTALEFIRNQTETSTWVRLQCSHQTKPGRCENTLKPHLFHFYLHENSRGLL